MARSFDVPQMYRSSLIAQIKEFRRAQDPLKRDLSPSRLDFGPVVFLLARHFGFCYGVENAIEIAYKALDEHPGNRIFLLSEIIHNQHVNEDLLARGVRFLRSTLGEQLIPFSELQPDDIVIIPAFGTTLDIASELESRKIDIQTFDSTCPFVEKVWNRSAQIGSRGYTVVVHGKHLHEETRATFSHAEVQSPVVVVRNMEEAQLLAAAIRGELSSEQFENRFSGCLSTGFNPDEDLGRIGVVNQTTMLASETAEIASVLKEAVESRFGSENIGKHFADTSDTLCYATNENQDAVLALTNCPADLAIVVGGTNSSNTSHLVEICEQNVPTFFISRAAQIGGRSIIEHFDLQTKTLVQTHDWLTSSQPVIIQLAAGASCPDVLLEEVISTICVCFPNVRSTKEVMSEYSQPVN